MILMVLTAGYGMVEAQKMKKPKLSAAEAAWKNGEFATAKEIVDNAIIHEKTKEDSKSWFLRGLVYASMDTTGMDEGDISVARESFMKARELKGSGGENFISTGGFPLPQSQVETNYWAFYVNAGIDAFQQDNTEGALEAFTKSSILVPDSIAGNYYAGLAAISLEKNDIAYNNFKTYTDAGGTEIDAYTRLAFLMANDRDDKEGALAFIRKSMEKFPGNKDLQDWEFRLLFDLNMVDDAIAALKRQIEAEPTNPELYFNLAVMYEKLEDMDQAKSSYEKALEVDPDYFNALFNLGVMYRNKLVDLATERNNLGISKEDLAKEKELVKQIEVSSKEALPFWEKAREMKPEDRTTLETLQYIYVQLKDYDKAEEVQNKMKELGFSEEGN